MLPILPVQVSIQLEPVWLAILALLWSVEHVFLIHLPILIAQLGLHPLPLVLPVFGDITSEHQTFAWLETHTALLPMSILELVWLASKDITFIMEIVYSLIQAVLLPVQMDSVWLAMLATPLSQDSASVFQASTLTAKLGQDLFVLPARLVITLILVFALLLILGVSPIICKLELV
jgi:hypothetical protein